LQLIPHCIYSLIHTPTGVGLYTFFGVAYVFIVEDNTLYTYPYT